MAIIAEDVRSYDDIYIYTKGRIEYAEIFSLLATLCVGLDDWNANRNAWKLRR